MRQRVLVRLYIYLTSSHKFLLDLKANSMNMKGSRHDLGFHIFPYFSAGLLNFRLL